MIIDSHAHLLREGVDTRQIIENMAADGLEKIITIGTKADNSIKAVELAEENENIYCAVGIHPDYANEITEADLETIDRLASCEKVVAVGEIGLDYHNNSENKEAQKDLFIKQIKIAKKHNLPICIHSRNAKEDTYEILKAYKDDLVLPSVMHCFSEDREYAFKFIDLGFYISYSGNITYKKSDRSYLKELPLDKILVETDSPFLSPEPYRGVQNVPARVNITAQKIADVIQMDVEQFKEKTVENTYRVFKKMK